MTGTSVLNGLRSDSHALNYTFYCSTIWTRPLHARTVFTSSLQLCNIHLLLPGNHSIMLEARSHSYHAPIVTSVAGTESLITAARHETQRASRDGLDKNSRGGRSVFVLILCTRVGPRAHALATNPERLRHWRRSGGHGSRHAPRGGWPCEPAWASLRSGGAPGRYQRAWLASWARRELHSKRRPWLSNNAWTPSRQWRWTRACRSTPLRVTAAAHWARLGAVSYRQSQRRRRSACVWRIRRGWRRQGLA